MKLIIADQMYEPHVKALGLRWESNRTEHQSTDPLYLWVHDGSLMDGGSLDEDDIDAWHDVFNALDFQDLFLCGDEDAKTFFLISDGDYELLENFLKQFDVIHEDNDVAVEDLLTVNSHGVPDISFDCGPEDVEAFLKENRSEDYDANVVVTTTTTTGNIWEYCFDDREKMLLEWALNELETSRDTDDTEEEVNVLLKKIKETGTLGYWERHDALAGKK
jgi:hypothetical protein